MRGHNNFSSYLSPLNTSGFGILSCLARNQARHCPRSDNSLLIVAAL